MRYQKFLLAFVILPFVGVIHGQTLNPTELQQWLKDREQGTRHFLLVDVRTPAEYRAGFIPGTDTLLPLQDFQMGNVVVPVNPQKDTVVVYCRTGHRAGIVQNLLKKQGFRFVFNGLGIVQWKDAGYSLTTEKPPSVPPIFYTLRGMGAVGLLAKTRTPETWQAGKNMTYITVTPDGQTVLATSSAENKVYVFSTKDGTLLRTISVGKSPKGVKVSPNGKVALVAEEGDGTLGVIDLQTWKGVRTIPVGSQPHNIVFTPDGSRAFVTIQGDDAVVEVDLQGFKVERRLEIQGSPHNLDLTPDGRYLLTANRQRNDVAVVDVAKWKIIQRIPVSPGHHGIDVTPDGRYALVTGIGADTLNLIDLKALKRVKTVVVGKGPHGVRASPDGTRAYVAVAFTNEIVEVEIPSLRILRRYPTAEIPFWIAVPGNP